MKVFIFLTFLIFSTAAYSASWVKLATASDGSVLYIDESTLVQRSRSLQFWLRSVPVDEAGYTEKHIVVICPSRKTAVVSERYYNENSEIVNIVDRKQGTYFIEMNSIIPESIEDLIADKYCGE